MRLLIAALAITFTVAIGASVFAIWPVVADAPWEDDPPVVTQPVDRMRELRCQAGLDLRLAAANRKASLTSRSYLAAEAEIDRYC